MYFIEEKFSKERNISNFGIIVTKEENESNFSLLNRIMEYNSDNRIKKIFVIGNKIPTDYVEGLNNIYFLDKEYDKTDVYPNLVYPKNIVTENQFIFARQLGYKNFILSGNLLQDKEKLLKYKKEDETFWAVPNNAAKGQFWIRPEGISLYNNIIDYWLLYSDNTVANILRRYQNEITGVLDPLIICNLNYDSKTIHCLPRKFDELRASCKGRCLSCNKCNRLLNSFNFLNKNKEKL